jgi:hypothetical protein
MQLLLHGGEVTEQDILLKFSNYRCTDKGLKNDTLKSRTINSSVFRTTNIVDH